MLIKIKSRYGEFEIGGGNGGECRLLSIEGLGPVSREVQSAKFEGEAGYTIGSVTDSSRAITMLIDIRAGRKRALEILKIIQAECEIFIYSDILPVKIKGYLLNGAEAEKIIYNNMYKSALQFECPNPYFEDAEEPGVSLSTRTDMFPTSYEDGQGYITLPAAATERKSENVIVNSGDIPVYAKFIITAHGDMESIILENRTTGKKIQLNYSITDGEVITVDVKNREIFSSIMGNILSKQSDDTVMSEFYFAEGENDLLLANNTSNSIDVIIEFANQYKAVMI